METLANLESFVRSAESGSFSAAARRLGLTPAAISRNVAQLERNLGVRLFQRTTRGLRLSEVGERFLRSMEGGLDSIQAAIADVVASAAEPSGVLKLSAAPGFATRYVLPLLPAFLARYPAIVPDLSLDNRPVDMVRGGFDAAIGGGFDLSPGMIARELGRIHLIAAASPGFLRGRRRPKDPSGLLGLPGVVMRSPSSSRVRTRIMRRSSGVEIPALQEPSMIVDDADALCQATVLGLGVGLIAVPHAAPYLESGALERLLPDWYVDLGPISLYFASHKFLPAKTRAFVDFFISAFRTQKLAQALAAHRRAER